MTRKWLLSLAVLPAMQSLMAASPVPAQPPASQPGLSFETIFIDNASSLRPTQFSWSPDGSRLAYLWDAGEGPALWVIDPMGSPSEPEQILTQDKLATVVADENDGATSDLEIDGYQWNPAGSAFLVEAAGDLFWLDEASGRLERLTETPDTEEGAALSPAGGVVAYSRNSNLFLLDVASGKETAVTDDGMVDEILNAKADWVYWEEIWGRDATALWWSPDGSKVAFYRFDDSKVHKYPLLDPLPNYPEVRWQRYPKAGGTNPEVRIGVYEISTGETQWMQAGPTEGNYFARVDWLPGSESLSVQRLDREQDRIDLMICRVGTGSCDTALSETWPTWVNLGDELTWLSRERFIWGSERSGWRRLYLADTSGTHAQPVSPEEVVVTGLDSIDRSLSQVVFTGFQRAALGALQRQVYRLSLGDGSLSVIAGREGWNEAVAVSSSGLWVHRWSDVNTPPALTIRDATGAEIATLPSLDPGFSPEALSQWELMDIPGPQGSRLPAALLKPAGFDPSRTYPVIMYHYGGPGSQVVVNRWGSRSRALWHKMMAERGWVVFSVDNQGSVAFGKRGEDLMHRRFGEVNLAAQIHGAEFLRRKTWVDGERIGLWGWSGGGSNTLYCILNRPGVWAAAVAGAPVTKWYLYDTIWTERYLDHPDNNPEGYEASSAVTYAANLADPLLVVHGTADDNVHPQNSLVLSQRFIEAGVPFESAFYPTQKHGFKLPHSRHFYERMTEFFTRTLAAQ